MSGVIAFPPGVLPWSGHRADEERFRRILARTLGVCLAVALVMPWLPVRPPDRSQPRELPLPMAKLLLERPLPPVAPARPAEPQARLAEADSRKPDAPRLEPSKAEAAKVPVPEARRPQPGKPPGEVGEARRRASGVGLLAMASELAEIRGAPVAVQLKQDIRPGPGVGTNTGPGVGAGFEPGLPTRALITSNATRGSGGINTAAYSRDTGGGGLAGRATTLVEGVAGGGGGGGYGGGGAVAGGGAGGTGKGAGGTVQRSGSGKASRSIEEIRLVFERNKGAIYALYNRALREDPTLQGKVVLELKIAPSGAITELRLVSSELKAADLEGKLLARIRQFDFGAKDVEAMTVTWPVDFLPS
jgi:outer membrane biosynthesis protein TonB